MSPQQLNHSAYLLKEFDSDLKSEDASIRKTALTCLIRLGSGAEIFDCVHLLAQEDPDAEIRFLARKAIDRLNIKERPEFREARILIRRLLENRGEKRKKVYERVFSSEDSFMKLELLISLFSDEEARKGAKFLCSLLTGLISSEKDRSLVPSYVKGLGVFGDASVLPLLQRCLQSKNPRVAANAIDALESLEDDCAQNMVLPLLSHSDNRVRANAVKFVFGFDPERAVQELVRMSQSSKPWMRISTLYCLRVMDFSERNRLLIQMFQKEEEPEVLSACLKLMTDLEQKDFALALLEKSSSFPESLKSDLNTSLESIIRAVGLNRDQLNRDLRSLERHDLSTQKARVETAEKTSQDSWVKRGPERRNKERRKSQPWLTSPLLALTGVFFIVFILGRLGFETGVVSKSYTLDSVSRARSLSTHATQSFFLAEYLKGRKRFKAALEKYEEVLASNPKHQKSIHGREHCRLQLKQTEKKVSQR